MFRDAVAFALYIYVLLVIARVVLSYILAMVRDWRPRGLVLILVEGCFTATDPPIHFVQRLVPPIAIGRFHFDLAPSLVIFACVLAQLALYAF